MIPSVFAAALVLVAVSVSGPVVAGFALMVGLGAYAPGRLLCPRGLEREEEVAAALVLGSTFAAFLWIAALIAGLSPLWGIAVLGPAAVAGLFRPLPASRIERPAGPAAAVILCLGAVAWTQLGNASGDPAASIPFYGTYAPEALFHCALSQELRHAFPPEFPAGETVSYHVLYNVLAAMVAEGTGASMLEVHYRLLPMAIVPTVSLAALAFVRRAGGGTAAATTGVLFLFFADDLAWLLVVSGLADADRVSGIWGSLLGAPVVYALHHNRAFLLGVAGFLVALSLAARALEGRDRHSFWAAAILTACLAEVKVFYPFLVLGAVAVHGLVSWSRRPAGDAARVFALLAATTIALVPVTLLILSGGGTGASPGEFLFPGYVGLVLLVRLGVFPDWETLRSVAFDDPLPIVAGWLPLALVLFTVGTLGVRALGLLALSRGGESWTVRLSAGAVATAFAATLVFVTPPARINVVYLWGAALCLLSVLAGLELWRRFERGHWIVPVLAAVLALPGTVHTLRAERSFLTEPTVVVSEGTSRAADVLRREARPGDVLLESKLDWSVLPAAAPVRPVATWHSWWENAFGRDEKIRRLRDVRTFFRSGAPDRMRAVLRRYGVAWVWVAEGENVPGLDQLAELEPVFSENGSRLYRVTTDRRASKSAGIVSTTKDTKSTKKIRFFFLS